MNDKKIKIYMAQPSTGTRSSVQVQRMREIQRNYSDRVQFVYPTTYVERIWHDFARNGCVEEFLETDCDVLWFLDSDIVPHPDCLGPMLERYTHWSLAGCPYPVFMSQKGLDGPQIVFTVYRRGANGFIPSPIPESGQDFVDGIATGCLFIKREVFSKLGKPYFEHRFNPETRELIEGEDLHFCRTVNDLGFKFFVDYSLVCKHYKTVDLLDVNNYAIGYANTQVMAYDRVIKDKLLINKKFKIA